MTAAEPFSCTLGGTRHPSPGASLCCRHSRCLRCTPSSRCTVEGIEQSVPAQLSTAWSASEDVRSGLNARRGCQFIRRCFAVRRMRTFTAAMPTPSRQRWKCRPRSYWRITPPQTWMTNRHFRRGSNSRARCRRPLQTAPGSLTFRSSCGPPLTMKHGCQT